MGDPDRHPAYIFVYTFGFSRNYYGGGQSLGNRYFLQIAPSLLALAVVAKVNARALTIAAIGGAVLSVLFMWPHFQDPSGAYSEGLARTSWLQRRFPAETEHLLRPRVRAAEPLAPIAGSTPRTPGCRSSLLVCLAYPDR